MAGANEKLLLRNVLDFAYMIGRTGPISELCLAPLCGGPSILASIFRCEGDARDVNDVAQRHIIPPRVPVPSSVKQLHAKVGQASHKIEILGSTSWASVHRCLVHVSSKC